MNGGGARRGVGGPPSLLFAAACAAGISAVPGAAGGQEPAPAPAEEERFTVEGVEVRGLDALDPPVRLPERLPLRPGDTYSTERAAQVGRVVSEAFSERGRPYAVVVAGADLDRQDATARVTLTVVDPGPLVRFGEPSIFPDPPLDDTVVRERVAFAAGEPFRPSLLDITRAQLERLPVVQHATVIPVGLADGDTVITTEIHVGTVPDPRGPQVGGTISSFRCIELAALWRDRYFLGGPRLFTASVGFGNLLASELGGNFPCGGVGEGEIARTNYDVRAELAQPLPGEPLSTVWAGFFVRRESQAQAYVLRGLGARVGIEWPLGREVVGGLSYAPERTEVRAAGFYYCAVFGACVAEEVRTLAQSRWLAPVEARALWVPGWGRQALGLAVPVGEGFRPGGLPGIDRWWLGAQLGGAGPVTGSDHTYGRGVVEGGRGWILGVRSEAALRARVGGLRRGDDPVPPQVRFFAGGIGSVRGIGQNLLGPLVLLAAPDALEEIGCPPAPAACPEGLRVDPGLVDVRPRGGDFLLEGGIEGRIRVAQRVQLAAFLDAGAVRGEDVFGEQAGSRWDAALTPGIGVRFVTAFGLLRLDVGYDPRGGRDLPILTEVDGDFLRLGTVRWNPHTRDDPGAFREFLRRLNLGVAVGQPF